LAQGRSQRSLKEVCLALRSPLREVFSEEASVRFPSNERRMSDQIEQKSDICRWTEHDTLA
jgi:hypothetical protein